MGRALPCSGDGHSPRGRDQHDGDHRQRDHQLAQDGGVDAAVGQALQVQLTGHPAQRLGQRRQQHRAQHHARDVADAAQHHHGHDHHALLQREALGRDEALEGGEHHARHTAEGGAHAEGQQLEVAGVDAHGLGGDLVLADGHPGAADAALFQPVADHHAQHHQQQEQVVVLGDRRDLVAEQVARLAEVQAEELQAVDLRQALAGRW